MGETVLRVPFEWGNMMVWLWLEVFAIGMLVLWTMNLARILIARHLSSSNLLRISHQTGMLDMVPMNGDIRELPPFPKFTITFIRFLITLLVAISTLGIESGNTYQQARPTTHVIVPNDFNFTGRSFSPKYSDSITDFAVAACEEVEVVSLKKLRSFVADSIFSCTCSRNVCDKRVIVEVIWDRKAIEQISRAEKRPVNIRLGDLSKLSNEDSNRTDVMLADSTGKPIFMNLNRRYLKHATFGNCKGEREYLLVYNNKEPVINGSKVAVALVICNPGSSVLLRNTDQMIFLPDLGANQQMNLARRVAGSLVSIVENKNEYVYFGETRRTTKLMSGYNYFILILGIMNFFMFLITLVLERYYGQSLHIDVFSPVSMYSLAESYWTDKQTLNARPEKGIQLYGEETEDGLEIHPIAYSSPEPEELNSFMTVLAKLRMKL